MANLISQSGNFPVPIEGSDQKLLPVDLKHARDALASTDQRTEGSLLQAPNIPSLHLEEHVPISGQIPGFVHDCLNKHLISQSMVKNVKQEQVCAQS